MCDQKDNGKEKISKQSLLEESTCILNHALKIVSIKIQGDSEVFVHGYENQLRFLSLYVAVNY